MASPQDENKPKYMCLKGKTQFEMAAAIDEALAQAENAFARDVEQMALQLWYEPFEQFIQEELNISQENMPPAQLNGLSEFITTCVALAPFVHQTMGNEAKISRVLSTLEKGLKQSLSDTLDLLKARNLWRFDLQRSLQDSQGRIVDEWRQQRDT